MGQRGNGNADLHGGRQVQRQVSAEKAGLFCALNPLTAATLGALFLGERLSTAGLSGAGCIALGFLLRSLPEGKGLLSAERKKLLSKLSFRRL